MKFKVGDKVLVTAGKDKGKKSEIVAIFPKANKAIIKDVNMYTKNVKPFAGKPGEQVRRERAMDPGKFAILNDKGKIDRIGYKVDKSGKKTRVFKKSKGVVDTKTKK